MSSEERFFSEFYYFITRLFPSRYLNVTKRISPATGYTPNNGISYIRIPVCIYLKEAARAFFWFLSYRLEQRLATRRARLAELRQQMEKEREGQPQNDPEAMKTLTRVQVRVLVYCAFVISSLICLTILALMLFCNWKKQQSVSFFRSFSFQNRTLNIKLK